jgi:hypothetical protein
MLPIKTVDPVLDASAFDNFLEQLDQSHLDFCQEYPRRLFSSNKHQPWLQEVFGDFITQVAKPYCNAKAVQQIFVGYELPGCNFMLHRSHPAIAGVVIISLDDFPTHTLACLTNSFDDPDDYLSTQKEYTSENYNFKTNSALIIKNSEPRHHWGFGQQPIGVNTIKRSVWIYLGKEH